MSEKEIAEHQASLLEGVQAVLFKTPLERIEKAMEKVWIPYPKALSILNELELAFLEKANNRMQHFTIVGDSTNGKTTILTHFIEQHPSFLKGGQNHIPIVYFSAPIAPSSNILYEKILDALNVPYLTTESSSRKEKQVENILSALDTKMIIIDEMQDIYHGGVREQTKFLSALKQLGTNAKVSVIVAGVPEVQRTLSSEIQIARRFDTLRLDTWEFNEDFARLLMSFEKTLPLREPSRLHRKSLVQKIHWMSEGLIGEVAKILTKSTIYAIQNNKESIDLEILESIPYERPSDRRK